MSVFAVQSITADNVSAQASGFAAGGRAGAVLRVSTSCSRATPTGVWRLSGAASASGQTAPRVDNVIVGVQSREWRSTLTLKHTLTLEDGASVADVRKKATLAGDVVGAEVMGLLRVRFRAGQQAAPACTPTCHPSHPPTCWNAPSR